MAIAIPSMNIILRRMRKLLLSFLSIALLTIASLQAQNTCCIGENLGGTCLGEENCENFVSINCDTLSKRCFQKWWTWPGTSITAEDYVPANLVFSKHYEGSRSLHMVPDANGATPDVVKDLFDVSSGVHRLSWKMYVPAGKTGYFNIQHDFKRLMRGQPNWAYQVFFTPDGSVQVRVGAEGTFRVASFKPDCWLKVTQVINLDRDSVQFFLNNRLVARWKFSYGVVDLDNDNRGDQKIVDRKLGAVDFYANEGFEYYIDKICYQKAPVFTGGNCPATGLGNYCLGGILPYTPANACGLPAYDGYVEGEEAFAGACNPGVSACADAIPIACGQSLTNQNTGGIGGKNTFTSKDFSSCVATQNAYGGNDKVYRITITEPSNLLASLNILDAGRNLDMFLLKSCLTYPLATTSQPECAFCMASSTNNNLNDSEESFSVFLEPGTYFLVVHGQAGVNARFDLSISCGCSCVEGGDSPLGANVLCENFDGYNNGNLVAQSPRWKVWDAGSNDASIEASTDRVGKVLRIQRTATSAPDVLLPLGNRTTGRYRLSFNLLVAKGASGYFNIQHTDAGGANPNWAFQVEFQDNSLGKLVVANRVIGSFYYKNGDWNKIMQIIDLDKDRAELWINNQMISFWRFSQGTPTDLKQLGALNFYANTGNNILVDNICMFAKETVCSDATRNPVCLSDGRSYRNETQARCDLYTAAELGACVSVCDLGGTMIYRGDRFSGNISPTDFAPNLSWQDSCVTATFTNQALDSLFGHSYIFYNDEANPFSINLSATNGARAFIYRCSQDGISSNSGRFRCVGRDGETFSQKGYFYVLILAPRSNSTYTFSVLPEATCRLNPTEIACNVSFSNTLSGASRYGIGAGSNNAYQSCYQGARTYAGSDREFSFRLTKPCKVSISLQGQAGLGVFLYDFLCGKNCLAFAETNDLGALIRSDTLMLNPGVYYLIVDQAISGSNGAYTLSVNCSDYTKGAVFLKEIGAASCAVNASSRHNLVLRSLRNTRINGQRLNPNDQLNFFYPKNSRGDLLSTTANWNSTELQVPLPQDATGDTLKCGYAPNDVFKIKLTRNNVSYDLSPQYQPIDGNIVTATNRFVSGGTSLITELNNCCTPHSLRVSPSQRKLTGQGGVAEFKIASNMSWSARKMGTSPWLKVTTSDGFANDILRVEVDPNNTNADRMDTLLILGPENEIQKVVISQSRSSCATVAVNAGPDRQICRGETLNLTASGVGNFLWSTGQSSAAVSVRPQVNSTYTVTITQGGCSGVDEVNVIVSETPVIDLGPDLQLCSGDNIVFVATGGDTYRWNNGATTATISIRPVQNSTFSVTVTKSGCSASDQVNVDLETAPQVSISPNQTICTGQSAVLTSSGGASYLWSNGRTSSTISVSPFTTTPYTVTVTNGNCSAIGRTAVNVTPGPSVTASIDLTICAGESPTLAASGTGPFRWSTGATTSSITVNPVNTTNYGVSVSANGCEASDNVLVSVLPKPIVNVSQDQIICSGQVANLVATGTGGGTYRWNTGATSASIQVQPIIPSEYTVSVSKDGCTSTDKVIVDVNATPTANAGLDQTITCTTNQVRLDGSKSASGVQIRYQWMELDGGLIVSGKTAAVATVSRPGNYSLLVTNSITGCSSTDQVTVGGSEPLSVTSIQLLEVRCFGEATGSANLTLRGGQAPYNYTWSNGATTNVVRGLKAGKYTVTLSDQGNCRDTMEVEIKQPERLTITNIRIVPAPAGNVGGIDISVAGGSPPYDFRWFNGNTLLSATEDLKAIGIGTYVVEVYDANNCSFRSDPISVSRTVGLHNLELANASKLYPNPTDGKTILELNLTKPERVTLELYDQLGRKLEQRKLESNSKFKENLDLSNRAAGVYFLRIISKDGFAVKEVIKE